MLRIVVLWYQPWLHLLNRRLWSRYRQLKLGHLQVICGLSDRPISTHQHHLKHYFLLVVLLLDLHFYLLPYFAFNVDNSLNPLFSVSLLSCISLSCSSTYLSNLFSLSSRRSAMLSLASIPRRSSSKCSSIFFSFLDILSSLSCNFALISFALFCKSLSYLSSLFFLSDKSVAISFSVFSLLLFKSVSFFTFFSLASKFLSLMSKVTSMFWAFSNFFSALADSSDSDLNAIPFRSSSEVNLPSSLAF